MLRNLHAHFNSFTFYQINPCKIVNAQKELIYSVLPLKRNLFTFGYAGSYCCAAFLSSYSEQGFYSCSAASAVEQGLSGAQSSAAPSGAQSVACMGLVAPPHVIFLDEGSNQCLLHWQADSSPGKPVCYHL